MFLRQHLTWYPCPAPPPSQIEDSTHTHLPNIETSSQLLEPDQSLIARKEIDVTYAKLSKAQRKRKPPTTRAGASAATNIPVKCKTAEVEEVFPSVRMCVGCCRHCVTSVRMFQCVHVYMCMRLLVYGLVYVGWSCAHSKPLVCICRSLVLRDARMCCSSGCNSR